VRITEEAVANAEAGAEIGLILCNRGIQLSHPLHDSVDKL